MRIKHKEASGKATTSHFPPIPRAARMPWGALPAQLLQTGGSPAAPAQALPRLCRGSWR